VLEKSLIYKQEKHRRHHIKSKKEEATSINPTELIGNFAKQLITDTIGEDEDDNSQWSTFAAPKIPYNSYVLNCFARSTPER